MSEGTSQLELFLVFVDDEKDLEPIIDSISQKLELKLHYFSDPKEAVKFVNEYYAQVAFILSDLKMPEMDGIELRNLIKDKHEDIPFAIVSSYVTKELALSALSNKICGFVDKPIDQNALIDFIKKESSKRIESLQEENELIGGFLEEASNMVEELEAYIFNLESAPNDVDAINGMFRILHTIKGTSAFFKPTTINRYTHQFEDFLSPYKNKEKAVTSSVVSVFFKGLDQLNQILESLRQGERKEVDIEGLVKLFSAEGIESEAGESAVTDQVAQASGKKADTGKDWVKVPISMLDQFMRKSGENTVLRNMINKLATTLEMQLRGNKDIQSLSELLEEMHSINLDMQKDIMELRQVSLKEIYRPLKRTVRDISTSLKKEVEFETLAEDLRVDTAIADVLKGSLIHMIRNSLDHGLEAAEDREKSGKPRKGQITLNAFEQGENVCVEIKDDGKGIDPDIIRKKLLEKGMVTESGLAHLSESEVLSKIFDSGFSTAAQVTDVSGRGVGMDQVKSSVENLGGTIDVESKVGKGTRILITMPIPKSVEIITSIIVKVGEDNLAIPRDNVVRIINLEKTRKNEILREVEKGFVAQLDDELLPIIDTRKLIGQAPSDVSGDICLVIVKNKKNKFALHIDQVVDSEETVGKPIPEFLKASGVFLGATFQSDGLPGLILDIENLSDKLKLAKTTKKDRKIEGETVFEEEAISDQSEFLFFDLGNNVNYAVPLCFVKRLEKIDVRKVERSGSVPVCRYRGELMPLIDLSEFLGTENHVSVFDVNHTRTDYPIIVIEQLKFPIGLIVDTIQDVQYVNHKIDSTVSDRPGILGNFIWNERITVVIDVWKICQESSKRLNHRFKDEVEKSKGTRSGVHILYAEDVDFYRDYIERGLKNYGYSVTAVANGKDALDRLKYQKGESFSLILTDINMPQMNGYELAKRIKGDSELSQLPVIALTGNVKQGATDDEKYQDFDGFLEKLNIEKVVEALDKLNQ